MPHKKTDSPHLFDYGGDLTKDWYVQFRMVCPDTGTRKPFQLRFGINYLTTLKERYSHGDIAVKAVKEALTDGWNPFTHKIKDFLKQQADKASSQSNLQSLDYSQLPFNEALDFGLKEKKGLSPKTRGDYATIKELCQRAAAELLLDSMAVGITKRPHIKLLLSKMQEYRQAEYDKEGKGKKFTPNNYNKYKRQLSAIFDELLEQDAVEYNPCCKIKPLDELITNKHRQATVKEEMIIKKHLSVNHPALYKFLAYEELSGLRPDEILSLHIHDIDRLNQCLKLWEDEAKTKEARLVPIPNELMSIIESQYLENYNPEFYIFGPQLLPGIKRQHRNNVTYWWDKCVHEALGIDVTLYSFKGLGGEKKRNAGISHAAVQKQFGHRNSRTTDIYLPNERERELDQVKNLPSTFAVT